MCCSAPRRAAGVGSTPEARVLSHVCSIAQLVWMRALSAGAWSMVARMTAALAHCDHTTPNCSRRSTWSMGTPVLGRRIVS